MTPHLLHALKELLGSPHYGTVVFARCFSKEEIGSLLETAPSEIADWQFHGVGEGRNDAWISGDKAVELRENKGPAACLLVVSGEAGAGMDGIYNAGRELAEKEILKRAMEHARSDFPAPVRKFAEEAVKRARKAGGRKRMVTGRQILSFYDALRQTRESPGVALPELDLWPVAGDAEQAAGRLAHSALMMDRLFHGGSATQTPSIRVASLSLDAGDENVAEKIEKLLRSNEGSVGNFVREVAKDERTWLGNLKPAFLEGRIQRLDIVPWRSLTGKLMKWSGLTAPDGDEAEALPQFRINDECKLTVKWRVWPDTLPARAATYEVQLLCGDDVVASETVEHKGKAEQKVVFDKSHFEDFDEATRQEARIRIAVSGNDAVSPGESDDFILCFGEAEASEKTSSGEVFRCVSEGAVQIGTRGEVEEFLEERQKGEQGMPDRKGRVKLGGHPESQMLSFRPRGSKRGFRVERPGLLKEIEEDWQRGGSGSIGRWRVRCRPDGMRAGKLEFVPLAAGDGEDSAKLLDATRRFREDCLKSGGILSRMHLHGHASAKPADNCLNAWIAALEKSGPDLALAFTLEIASLSGSTIGLIVLPHHPLRLAWQCAYDALALHLSLEERLKVQHLRKSLSWLDSANVPFLLPGIGGSGPFVFADGLGFAGVLMVRVDDAEPKASAALLAACYSGDAARLRPSMTFGAGDAMAREVSHYLETHPHCGILHVNAIKPGDGATVVKAIGLALRRPAADQDADEPTEKYLPTAIRLDMHPSGEQRGVAGSYLTRLTERRRKRSAAPADEDAWCLETLPLTGNRSMPRLRWACRLPDALSQPAHLTLAFDMHRTCVAARADGVETRAPFLAFGLTPHLLRSFRFEGGQPRWHLTLPEEHEGLKLPERVITERLVNLQQLVHRQVAASAGLPGVWPELLTAPDEKDVELLGKLHDLSDWVVTMDRNAGIEFYDFPLESESVFDAYVMDAVPERDDLGSHQVITSTKKFEEVAGFLHRTLSGLGLNGSARNCAVLLGHLKGLSGRLAMRLAAGARGADPARTSAELVALALARAKCHAARADDSNWTSLANGFLVPLDDVRDLIPAGAGDDEGIVGAGGSRHRTDLLHVGIPKRGRGRLRFTFIEVECRRYLSQARSAELCEQIDGHATANRDAWRDAFFSEKLSPTLRVLRAARLARVLRFYAEKARRHYLQEEPWRRAMDELAAMLKDPTQYEPGEMSCRGSIFCPDFPGSLPERQPWDGECVIRLFGPDSLPDQTSPAIAPPETVAPSSVAESDAETEGESVPPGRPEETREDGPGEPPAAALGEVCLGHVDTDKPACWNVSIKSNPHLMIVGLPGMGKTHALINICIQLQRQGIAPIVFSYHDDIDEKLSGALPAVAMHDCLALGFNPMTISQPSPVAHVESAGQMRDIFGAIFPDLGDIQREKLREAVKRGYEEAGWKDGDIGGTPEFRRFLELLRLSGQNDRSVQSLIMRLSELDDFNFFNPPGESRSLLDAAGAQVIRIHSVTNEAMQRASAAFILYRLYQDMFRRGRAQRMTHAVIFDEAHRAGSLKLLPTFAKESRKYGLALIVASQEARDFDSGLFSAIGSYLVLRVTDQDAKIMARNTAGSDQERAIADRLKRMPKYNALFSNESLKKPVHVKLQE